MSINPGGYTPEQSTQSSAPTIEPQSLEYGNQPEMSQPMPVEAQQVPGEQVYSEVAPVQQEQYQPEQGQYAEVPAEPVYEQQPAPVYQEMYPQNPMHPVTYEAAPQDFGTETYSVQENLPAPTPEQQPQPTQTIEQPNLYAQHSQEVIKTSEMPALQERLVRQSRDGERVFVNPNLDPRSGQQTQVVVTQQQVVSSISGYPVSNSLSTNPFPLSALLQQTTATGDPHAGTTWQAVLISKISTVLSRILPR